LLGKGRKVVYKRQDANYYWYGEMTLNLGEKFGLQLQSSDIEFQQPAKQMIRRYNPPEPKSPSLAVSRKVIRPAQIIDIPLKDRPLQQSECQNPLPDQDQEVLAIRVYEVLNTQSTDAGHRISRVTASRMVSLYGKGAVKNALMVLAKRNNIQRPVGFFISFLRSESKRHRLGHP
jgi:hypothetical protein